MKTLEQCINEAGLIKYDEKRHITGVDFSKLTNVGDNNILNDIKDAGLGMMISPEEEEFGYQWMNIYWDKLMIEFYMPNNLTNGAPMGFNFRIKIESDPMARWMEGNYEWKMDDFKLIQAPGSFVKLSKNMDKPKFEAQLCTLMAIVMNRQPEPLW